MFRKSSVIAGTFAAFCIAALGQNLPYPTHPLFTNGAQGEVPCQLPLQEFDDRSLWAANLWPGGVIPYVMNANVNATNANRLRIAMNELETVCNVTYVPRVGETNYIMVQNSTGNNSFVGRIGGSQTVNLVNWSTRYIICHELMHALGIFHEQQRSDRGTYVSINQANIQPTYYNANFPTNSGAPQGTYDFESIMHYDACSFSTCCPAGSTCSCPANCRSIDVLPAYAAFANVMGNRSYMSQGDKDGLVSRYGVAVDDALAPNSSLATSKPITLGTTYNLKLVTNTDYVKVTLPAYGTLQVAAVADNVWAQSNANVRILSAGGGQISQGFFIFDGLGYSASASRALPPGTYNIQVTRTQPWGGKYTLKVSTSCAAADFNGDDLVNDDDFQSFALAYNLLTCSDPAMPVGCPADINSDGFVDDADFLFFASAYDTLNCP
ncbi:MAG: M12 family metallopeptidase [Phycisphaerales bacterium]